MLEFDIHAPQSAPEIQSHSVARRLFAVCLPAVLMTMIFALPATASICPVGAGPGASLLFPFIELDPSGGGATTQISITNTSSTSQLANVVVWSNCSRPVLNFTLFLEAGQIRPLNLEQILINGQIPTAEVDNDLFPGCPAVLPDLDLDTADLASLAARLSGVVDPMDGLCYAEPTTDGAIRGFITVDVLNDCSETIRTPLDEGYFVSGGLGVAAHANVLAGDFFLIDGANDFAQGFEAIALRADAAQFSEASFYGLEDGRQPLSTRYSSRFLSGGDFDGGTELLVWAQDIDPDDNTPSSPPCECDTPGFNPGLLFSPVTEAGNALEGGHLALQSIPRRIRVGTDLPVSVDFGGLDLRFNDICVDSICPTVVLPRQGIVLPVYRAEGRFSAGLKATSIDDPCAEITP